MISQSGLEQFQGKRYVCATSKLKTDPSAFRKNVVGTQSRMLPDFPAGLATQPDIEQSVPMEMRHFTLLPINKLDSAEPMDALFQVQTLHRRELQLLHGPAQFRFRQADDPEQQTVEQLRE